MKSTMMMFPKGPKAKGVDEGSPVVCQSGLVYSQRANMADQRDRRKANRV